MKTLLKSFIFLFCTLSFAFAQVKPEKGFSYQGYARDFNGAALGSQNIVVKFTIYPEGENAEYEEEQTVKTDAYGVFATVIGQEKEAEFKKIDFSSKNYWLKVETKANNSDFAIISETELLAVPYAKSASKADNGIPPGTILPFAGSSANVPVGFLACDGSEVSQDDYPALYSAIGTNWGTGTGTNFRVPDLRGYFLRGWDNGAGNDPDAASRTAKNGGNSGDKVGSYQDDNLESHDHSGSTDSKGSHNHRLIGLDNGSDVKDSADGDITIDNNGRSDNVSKSGKTSTEGAHTHKVTINPTGGNETRPKNAGVLYIIKY